MPLSRTRSLLSNINSTDTAYLPNIQAEEYFFKIIKIKKYVLMFFKS